jgi:hypothetical protein
MASEPSAEELHQARQAFKVRMLVNALHELPLDARAAAVLRKNGLPVTAQGSEEKSAGDIAEVVANPAHPRRLHQMMGPIVFVTGQADREGTMG